MERPDSSAYFPEQLAKTREWLEQELLKGLESGPSAEMSEAPSERLLEEARLRAAGKRAS